MIIFGQMHGLTVLFIVLELIMLGIQLFFYISWPDDKRRLRYLLLLVLLICYNLTGGFFPDPHILWLSLQNQNIIAYGTGFLMAAYFPYYFYRSFELESLRFHAIYGVGLFLLVPYLVFFCVVYPISGDLDLVLEYGLFLPGLYSPVLLYAMFYSIRKRFDGDLGKADACAKQEMRWVYAAVFPWVFLAVFAYLKVEQWIEVLFTNTGFVVIAVLFVRRSGRYERAQKKRLGELEEINRRMRVDFFRRTEEFHLSRRESEIAELLCQGMSYKQIADLLFITENTVDTHAQNIFSKTGVNRKIDLQKTLGYGYAAITE